VVLTVPSGTPISCAELLRDPQGKLRYHTTFISINTHVSYFNDKTLNTVPAGNSNSRKPSPEFSLKTSQWFSLHVTFIQERSYANLSMTNTKGLLQNYSILSLLLLTCSNRCSDCVQWKKHVIAVTTYPSCTIKSTREPKIFSKFHICDWHLNV
jgi:hypothetical protein